MAGLQRTGALIIFAFVLIAYTLQTEAAQAVQRSYKKPCFLLWLTHSGFVCIFPIRLLSLRLSGKSPAKIRLLLEQLGATLKLHLTEQRRPPPDVVHGVGQHEADDDEDEALDPDVRDGPFPLRFFAVTILLSTLLITFPALSWYVAVSLTNTTIVTALFNTNALWALVLSHYLLEPKGTEWKRSTLLSVACAIVGVFIIAYGDYVKDDPPKEGEVTPQQSAGSHLAGSLLALVGSFGYAAYEVVYKWKIALPEPLEGVAPPSEALSRTESVKMTSPVVSDNAPLASSPPPRARPALYSSPRHSSMSARAQMSSRPSLSSLLLPNHVTQPVSLDHVSPTIFLLHADLITTLIGVTTISLFWIPLPLISRFGWEPWETPFGKGVGWEIVGMVAMGVIFNAGFMILLGLWGPITVSIGNLCTLVLVAAFDALSGLFSSDPNAKSPLTLTALLGSALILGSFGIMMAETFQKSAEREADPDSVSIHSRRGSRMYRTASGSGIRGP